MNMLHNVDDAISDLIESGCAKQMLEVLHVCSPLSVVVGSTGKKRLVINLRYLNQYLMQKKFKYEDIRTALTLMEGVSFLFTYDLKSGYHHIDIHVDSQTFLGFEWKGKYYVFTVLPFGLATAYYVFTKVLRPLVRYWRGQGIKCVLYLDDGIGLAANEVLARQYSEVVRCSLESTEFVANEEKSRWDHAQCRCWLGFDINLEKGMISIPQEKVDVLRQQLAAAL